MANEHLRHFVNTDAVGHYAAITWEDTADWLATECRDQFEARQWATNKLAHPLARKAIYTTEPIRWSDFAAKVNDSLAAR